MNEQRAALHQLWRKANGQDTPISLTMKTTQDAARLRYTLYNAVKPFRDGKKTCDAALLEAIENVSVSVSKENPCQVILQKKIMTQVMGLVMEVLGGELAPDGEAQAVIERNRRLEQAQQAANEAEESTARPRTPYY